MEDVLDVYERPYDPKRPQVCIDETCKDVKGDEREPLPPRPAQDGEPGAPARQDYEYVRDGSASIFMVYEPLTGRCYAEVSDKRAAKDYARIVKHVCDDMYPDAEKIVLVQDNLSTHTIGALYETFPPQEAHRLARRLEIHFTPTHGSWLNMAEIALRLLSGQCLARRIPDRKFLVKEVAAWLAAHTKQPVKTSWRFTTANARIKLKRLYPKMVPVPPEADLEGH